MSTRTSSRSARARSSLLQDMLLARRQALVASIRERLSSVREDRSRADHVTALDDGEVCDLDVQEDVELALVQMERETLVRLDAALTRLDNGLYGRCIDCADEISESRLKALPFAVRCLHCEEARESDVVHERMRERKLLRLAGVTIALTMMSLTVFAQSTPPVPGATGTIALEGTIDQETKAVNALAVKTVDGTRRVFHLAKDVVVHGSRDTSAESLKNLRAGTTVVVHYANAGGDAAIHEIDIVSDDGLKTTEGTVVGINRRKHEITLQLDNATTEVLQLSDRAARDVGHDIDSAAGSARIVLYYTDDTGAKVAHFFRRVK